MSVLDLNKYVAEKQIITVFLTNGMCLKGTVASEHQGIVSFNILDRTSDLKIVEIKQEAILAAGAHINH